MRKMTLVTAAMIAALTLGAFAVTADAG